MPGKITIDVRFELDADDLETADDLIVAAREFKKRLDQTAGNLFRGKASLIRARRTEGIIYMDADSANEW